MTDLCKHELSKHICIRCCRTERDALAAELAQWKNDNLEIAGKFTKANYRIRDLEAALRPVANHMVIDKDKEFIGGCYAIDVVQTAKGLVGSVLEPLPQTETKGESNGG